MKIILLPRFLFLLISLTFLTTSHAQTYQQKLGGVCFRFDDYQNPANIQQMRALFNKYGYKFTYAVNMGLGELYNDTAFWNVLKQMETDGHEIADQSPSDCSHYFDTKTPEQAQAFANRPGVDHVSIVTGSFNRVCLKYQILNANGAGDEGKVDISGNRIISKSAGEFAWSKLNNGRFTSHLYFPTIGKLVTMYDIKNANAADVDTIFVKSFWKEDITLTNSSNVSFKKLTPYDLSIEKEGLQTMTEFTFKIFEAHNLKYPVSFIHPGGSHPYVDRQVLKDAFEPFGYKGGAAYPYEKRGISYYNPKSLNQFSLQGGDITPENNTIDECKKWIAEYNAKNTIVVSINHFTSLGAVYSFPQMLLNLEQILIWCKANGIAVKTYKEWNSYYADGFFDQTDDIFPPLQNDFDKDGAPDGLTLGASGLIDTINGVTYSKNVCFKVSTNGTSLFSTFKIYGLNRGKNTLYLSTKGGLSTNDYLNLVINLPELGISKYVNVATNTTAYTERAVDIEVPNGATYINLSINYYTQTGQRVYVSGIKLKSAKKPSFKAFVIERKAHEVFPNINLSSFAACNGYTQSQLSFFVLTQPNHSTASLTGSSLRLLPKNNRFWVGIDSIRISVKAPDNTADTTWIQIRSVLGKVCKDQLVLIAITKDTINDLSYAWASKPVDPFLVSTNTNTVYGKPSQLTTYANTITFKNASKRTDSIAIGVLNTVVTNGPFELLRFNGNNSVTFNVSYPAYYGLQYLQLPGSGGSIQQNGSSFTITRNAGYIGNVEAKLWVTTPTCNGIIHTLSATTYAAGLETNSEKLFPILYYPNPFETSFNVRLPEIRNFRLTVFDMSGKLVFSNNYVSAKECSVQTETWKSGMYLIKLESDNQLFTSRMVKN